MDVARLNLSHGTWREHRRIIRTLKEIADQPPAILLDLSGPKIRVGRLAGDAVELKKGDIVSLTSGFRTGAKDAIPIDYPNLAAEVKVGLDILLDDGALEIKVMAIHKGLIKGKVAVGGTLLSHKGVNLPQSSLKLPSLTEKDKKDVLFGIEEGVDFFALSFVRRGSDIEDLKQYLSKNESATPIIAKIEKGEALEDIDDILARADGVMVARGDLGVEIPIEKVPAAQKMIIKKANSLGKPVITATQMLESMVDHPRPTRAEAADVANAILDGSDAVMLSQETSVGKYPVGAVKMMARIVREAERIFPYEETLRRRGVRATPTDAISHATCQAAADLNAAAIVTFTASGHTARMISRYRPRTPILAISPSGNTVRELRLIWGVFPLEVFEIFNTDTMFELAEETAKRASKVKKGDLIVITAGIPLGEPGTTNLLKVHDIS